MPQNIFDKHLQMALDFLAKFRVVETLSGTWTPAATARRATPTSLIRCATGGLTRFEVELLSIQNKDTK